MPLSIRFSTVVSGFLFIQAFAVVAHWFKPTEGGLAADHSTHAAALLLICVLAVFLVIGRQQSNAIIILLVMTGGVVYGLATVLLLYSDFYFTLNRFSLPTATEFTRAIYIAAGSVAALGMGILVAHRWGRRRGHERRGRGSLSHVQLPADAEVFLHGRTLILGGALFGLLGAGILTLTTGARVSGTIGGPVAFAANILDRDFFLFISLLVSVFYRRHLDKRDWVFVGLTVGAYIIVTLMQGSRGGLLAPVIFFVVISIVHRPNLRISARAMTIFIMALVLTAAVVWPLGSAVRNAQLTDGSPVTFLEYYNPGSDQDDSGVSWFERMIGREARMDSLIAIGNDWVLNPSARWSAWGLILHPASNLVPYTDLGAQDYPPVSRIYIIDYKGFPEDKIHGEDLSPGAVAWFIHPGPVAFLILATWGASATWLMNLTSVRHDGLGFAIRSVLAFFLAFNFFRTGSMESVLAGTLRWILMLVAINLVITAIISMRRAGVVST